MTAAPPMQETSSSSSGQTRHPNDNDLLRSLQIHGYNTHSFLSLYPGLQYFRHPGCGGYIAYMVSKQMVLAAGDPVASEADAAILIKAFLAHFKTHRKYIGFIPVSEKSTPLLHSLGFDKIHIGREPIFDLQNLPTPCRSIRQAMRRAQRKGLKVVPYDARYEAQLQKLCNRWQNQHEIPAMDFLFQLRPLEGRQHKKYFLLVDETEQLMALLACSPIYSRNGWYLEDFIRNPDCPNGGSELLIESALELLASEGYELATLAVAPLAGLPDEDNFHPIANDLLKLVYRRLSFIYRFQTLEFFKGKFGPSHWESNSFCFYPRELTPGLAAALIEAFLPGGIPTIVKHKLKQWASPKTLKRLAGQTLSSVPLLRKSSG